MDPLSITAAVAGLLGTLASISKYIHDAYTDISQAPRNLQTLLSELHELQSAVDTLKLFLQSNAFSSTGSSLISVQQLVTTLTETMLTITDLGKGLQSRFVQSWLHNRSHVDRLRIALSQTKLNPYVKRLQRNKTSLILIFNLVLCEASKEAAESQMELARSVEEMLHSNQELSDRIKSLETMLSKGYQNEAFDILDVLDEDGCERSRPVGYIQHIKAPGILHLLRSRPSWESVLDRTRVYQNATGKDCDLSLHTSITHSWAWSRLSKLSISQISNVSVIALPLYARDFSESRGVFHEDLKKRNPSEMQQPTQNRGPRPRSSLRGFWDSFKVESGPMECQRTMNVEDREPYTGILYR